MADIADVARHILDRLHAADPDRPVTSWKLQKLAYYAQAWSLVWDEKPLFNDPIEAWANGPVIPNLYMLHRGKFHVAPNDIDGDPRRLTAAERETVEAVVAYYGDRSSQWLSDLTHIERPWREARDGIAEGARSQRVISHEAMAEYYESLSHEPA